MIKSFIFCTAVVFASVSFAAAESATSEDQPVVNTTTSTITSATTTPAVSASTATAEEQIPLNIEVVKKSAEAPPASTRVLLTGLIISALLGAAYYFVRKYKTSNTINKSNMQIKVLSQHYLGPKKSLAIITVAGESILIGITDSNISMIKSLSLIDDEIPTTTPKTFADAMTRPKSQTATSMVHHANSIDNDNELDEEFSFAGLKDSVSKKLKSMRSI